MSYQSDKEYSPEVIALAYKIDKLNKDIEEYKAHIQLLEGKNKVLKNEIYELKAIIGLIKLQKQNEERNNNTSTNGLVSSDFKEIP